MDLKRQFSAAGVVYTMLAAMGCAGAVTTAGGQRLALTSPEFRDYVERVFRQQNQIATELAFAIEDAQGRASEARELVAVEDSLLAACAGLNRLATARRDEQRLLAVQQARAAREAPVCEAAISAARAALDRAAQASGDLEKTR